MSAASYKTTTDAINVTNDVLRVGSLIIGTQFGGVGLSLSIIAGVGGLMKDLFDNELGHKIEKMSEKMTDHFNSLEAFVSHHHFYAETAQIASTLNKFMIDTIHHPGETSMNIFRDAVKKHPPLENCYKLISLLEQDVTNPLKMAMKADKYKSTETFEKWEKIIAGVLSQFLYLETYLNGMFWNKDMYGPNRLAEKIQEYHWMIKNWKDEYKESYWPSVVRNIVEKNQENNVHKNNEQKANMLQQEISRIMTDDKFYIIIYNQCSPGINHAFAGEMNNIIFSFDKGLCNVVVYRSVGLDEDHYRVREDMEFIKTQVESCRHDTIPCRTNFATFPMELRHSKKLQITGFTAMIRDGNNQHIRSVNCKKYKWGPGWWIKAHVSLHQNRSFNDGRVPAFWLIAGY